VIHEEVLVIGSDLRAEKKSRNWNASGAKVRH
jgi:hypothetical protein